MPLRSNLLTKRWSTVELPILPFLAPRVFTPWPSRSRRVHTGTQRVQKNDTNEGNSETGSPKFDEEDRIRQKRDFLVRRLAAKDFCKPKEGAGGAVGKEEKIDRNAWGPIDNIYGTSLVESAEDSKEAHSGPFDDQFRRKYEEIWGVDKIRPSDRMNFQAEESTSKNEVSVSERRQFLRVIVKQETETVIKGGEKDMSSKEYDAVESRKKAERKLPESKHREAPDYRPDGEYTEQNSKHHQALVATHGNRGWPHRLHLKHVSWSPGQLFNPFLSWQKRFAALNLHQDGVTDKRPQQATSAKRLVHSVSWEGLIEIDSSKSLDEAWEALPAPKRGELWPELLLTALDEHPNKVIKLLMATYIEPYPPGYAVSDSLDYIISYYLGDRTVRNPKKAAEIFKVFEHMLRLGPPGHFHLSQKSVYLLLKNLDGIFVRSLFQLLTELGHPLRKHTLMHFPSQLKSSVGADERIEILKGLWREGSDFNSPEVSSVCATLLQRKNRSSTVSYSDSEIFEFMLECGMKPNIIIYNVLLQNSLEARDHETAWQIHDMMVENGIETDAYTYSLLLTDAKLRNDRPSIRRILDIVAEKGMRNAHIATDILHTIFIFRQNYEISSHWEEKEKGRPPKAFERMLTSYCQYFSFEPLAHIIPWLEDMYPKFARSAKLNSSESAPTSNNNLIDPAIPTLVVMLTALLRERTEPGLVVQFYNHFCDLVKLGDPTATALAKSTHVYNVILMALGRFPETLALCPRLIGDMLSQNAEANSTPIDSRPESTKNHSRTQIHRAVYNSKSHDTLENDQAKSEVSTGIISTEPRSHSDVETEPESESLPAAKQQRLHPMPDIYTWSILLKVFMDHGQPRAAEKVLSMMEDRRVWPNRVTWNSLVIGYARMQDMTMTVDAVNRLQRSGFDLDDVTMKGLSYFQNRRALIEAMRASEARNPGGSIKKRPSAIGKAFSALNKTIRIVKDGKDGKGVGLEPEK